MTESMQEKVVEYIQDAHAMEQSVLQMLDSLTASTKGWVRGWVGQFLFGIRLTGNRTHDAKDSPAFRREDRQYQAARHVR